MPSSEPQTFFKQFPSNGRVKILNIELDKFGITRVLDAPEPPNDFCGVPPLAEAQRRSNFRIYIF